MNDERLGLVALIIMEKMPPIVNKRITSAAVVQAATAQSRLPVSSIQTQLIPAYNQA